MKNLILGILLTLVLPELVSAQVDNYALRLSQGGNVSFGSTPKLDQLSSYTIQFWINVSVWNNGAVVLERGEGLSRFAVELGEPGELRVVNGSEMFVPKSGALRAGEWFQVSIVNREGVISAFLDNQPFGTSRTFGTIPSAETPMLLGGNGFEGLIDEFRFWNTAINDSFYRLWRNTVNKFHPNWSNLIIYTKFDQYECPNVVDYKFNYHGSFSVVGAERTKVTDNAKFKYLKHIAYSNFNRWFDCQIERDRFLLANEVILLIAETNADGEVSLPYSIDTGTVTGGEYVASFGGAQGVLKLNGVGASMRCDKGAFVPVSDYTFMTKLYLNQWTEGAYIFKKESEDGLKGFSVRLGKYDDKKRVYVRVNGVDYSFINRFDTGRWIDFGISTLSKNLVNKVFRAVVDGAEVSVNNVNQTETVLDYTVSGLQDMYAYVGLNINGYFDETAIWHSTKDAASMIGMLANGNPLPSDKIKIEAVTMWSINAYWRYDKPEEVGYDTYSWKGFVDLMKDHYKNYRGCKFSLSLGSFSGWESKFGDPAFRTKFAQSVANVAQYFDGVDLDFEWCYNQTCWDNYGEVVKAVRAVFPADKQFTITPHKVSYGLQTKYMQYVDHFLFQIYGPSKDIFLWSSYTAASNSFVSHGYPKDKIVMSYATTTSNAYSNASDAQISPVIPPVGVRSGLLEDKYTWGSAYVLDGSGNRRYITDPKQTIDRCEWVHDNGFAGIFYWDMGNDVPSSHRNSIVKHASFSINSNVDTIIRQVDMAPSAFPVVKQEQTKMKVYRNSSSGRYVCVTPYGQQPQRIVVLTVEGKPVYQQMSGMNREVTLPSDTFKKGYYLVEMICQSGKRYSNPLIIQ